MKLLLCVSLLSLLMACAENSRKRRSEDRKEKVSESIAGRNSCSLKQVLENSRRELVVETEDERENPQSHQEVPVDNRSPEADSVEELAEGIVEPVSDIENVVRRDEEVPALLTQVVPENLKLFSSIEDLRQTETLDEDLETAEEEEKPSEAKETEETGDTGLEGAGADNDAAADQKLPSEETEEKPETEETGDTGLEEAGAGDDVTAADQELSSEEVEEKPETEESEDASLEEAVTLIEDEVDDNSESDDITSATNKS